MSNQSEYRRILSQARLDTLGRNGVPRAANEQLYLLFAEMLRDIDRDFGVGFITKDRKDYLSGLIDARMQRLANQLGFVFNQQRRNAIEQAIRAHQSGLTSLGVTIPVDFSNVPDITLEYMLQRRGIHGSKNYQTLIGRGLKYMAPQVDRFLTYAIAEGLSAERASQQLAGMISRNDPKLLGLIDNGRLRKSNINKALKESKINLDTFKQARRALFDAKRIMVTEINTAYRESNIISSYQSPVVGFKQWRVSGRHYSLPSTPDVCTIMQESDLFGYGTGIFPILNCPSTLHPFCACRQIDILRPKNQWGDPKPNTEQPKIIRVDQVRADLLRAASTNKQLAAQLDKISENHINRQIEIGNEYTNLAYRWSRKLRKTG